MNTHKETLTDREILLRKIDRRDKFGRSFGLSVLAVLVVLNIYGIIDNHANILEHRVQVETADSRSKEQLKKASTANKARLDINLCIVSVPPQTRTPEYVHNCYTGIEKMDNVKVVRYGFGIDR
jgi:hypothetical protein